MLWLRAFRPFFIRQFHQVPKLWTNAVGRSNQRWTDFFVQGMSCLVQVALFTEDFPCNRSTFIWANGCAFHESSYRAVGKLSLWWKTLLSTSELRNLVRYCSTVVRTKDPLWDRNTRMETIAPTGIDPCHEMMGEVEFGRTRQKKENQHGAITGCWQISFSFCEYSSYVETAIVG